MSELPLPPEALLAELSAELEEVAAAVRARFEPLTPEQALWRPGPERWGVAHCLAHLTRTNRLYRERIGPALETARGSGREAPPLLKGSWFGRWFTRQVGPQATRRVTTPRLFRPTDEEAGPGAVADFLAEQDRLVDIVRQARGIDLDRIRIASPVTGLMRFRVTDALRIVAAHERRHLAQADRVLEEPGFPAG